MVKSKINSVSSAQTAVRVAQVTLEVNKFSEEVTDLLQEALRAEFQQWDLYYAYKTELLGLERDPIEEHFGDHAEEEAEHIDILQRYLVAAGIQPTKERKPIPELEQGSIEEIIALQLKFELRAIETYKKLLKTLEESPLKIEIENIIAQEMEHAQDLTFLLGGNK